jgi:glycosyltransferase involved in cell wall biosynthesis
MVEISIVVPVYCCADCLPALHQRLRDVLSDLVPSFEMVFIEDCGRDHSWEVLTTIARQDKTVKAFRLSRNFGQHAAITAGLAQASGEWVIVMDCDLQDPPEEIPYLYERAIAGYDIVLARRMQRQHSSFKKITAKLYFRLLNFLSQNKLEGEYGTFSIISRKVVNAYLTMNDVNRHYLFILQWLGFRTTAIEYKHMKRYSGSSSYSLSRLFKHAFDGIFFQTTALLKAIVYLGFILAFSGIVLAFYYIYRYLVYGSVPGWTSLSVLILLIGGFTIISTGITGLYIGKIFEQVKNRPQYVIDKQVVDGVER